MKFYRDPVSGEVFAFEEDGSQDGHIRPELVIMSDSDVDAHVIRQQPGSSAPQSVTMRQARLAMLQAGILDEVEAAILAMPGDAGRAARIDWEYSLDVRRDWPLISALAPQIGMTEQQVDELFVVAAGITQ